MSAGRKTTNSSNAGVRGSRTNADAARKWVAEETRAEAKEMFTQHTKETSSLDVLSRCKKLNELLSSVGSHASQDVVFCYASLQKSIIIVIINNNLCLFIDHSTASLRDYP